MSATRAMAPRLGLLLVVVLAANVSCNVNDYCLNCATNDGGGGGDAADANGDAADASGPPPDACIPTGIEICDGFDNDCNGTVDDGAEHVGDPCGVATLPCTLGVKQCVGGVLSCTGIEPTPEQCDNIDNDCDTTTDEGDPGGGGTCGTDMGECVAGIERCMGGSIQCVGAIGMQGADPEVCDGKDNDCDGTVDNGLGVLGPCGPLEGDTGECTIGSLMCVGGGPICMGADFPTFEACDSLDNDCDGSTDEDYDFTGDPQNCGGCGQICNVAHASSACSGPTPGHCIVGACDQDWHDANNDGNTVGTDGCEYNCQFQGPQEACNGIDDNCSGPGPGNIDEGVIPPINFCRQIGACAGSVPVCNGAAGWGCTYGADVSTDGMGNIVPESTCDEIDNDCDGATDESHPAKDDPCGDAGVGVCHGTGTFICDTTNTSGPVVCDITMPGGTSSPETCNGLDDNCDGVVDNGHATGNMNGQTWVNLAGIQIMKYEAARPDASAGSQGAAGVYVCSKAGVIPWTNVTRPQAQAACVAVGARLCTEAEWQSACFSTTQAFPITGPVGANDRVFIEAEEGVASGAVGGKTWTAYSATAGFSGIGGMQATPTAGGASVGCTAATQEANAPRVDFTVDIQAGNTGNYFIWTRMIATAGSGNDNSVCVGVDGTASNTTISTNNAAWTWVVSPAINVATTGSHRFSVYMREDGTAFDGIVISRNGIDVPIEQSFSWAYQNNPTKAQPQACNADPYDTVPGGADDDDVIATGSLAACFANGAGSADAFDMTGNVREWTSPRSAGVNAIRGGASNTEVNGTTCQDSFVLGSDTFFFPNVGFRCCR